MVYIVKYVKQYAGQNLFFAFEALKDKARLHDGLFLDLVWAWMEGLKPCADKISGGRLHGMLKVLKLLR